MQMRSCKSTLILPFFLFLVAGINAKDLPRLLGIIRSDTSHAYFGYTIVPIGDQNDDGYDDFVSWDARAQGYVFRGGVVVDITRSLIIDDSLSPEFANLGDFNDDGFADIVGRGRVNGRWKTSLYYGGPAMDGHRDAWFGYDSLYGALTFCRGYDLNGNGTPEIVAQSNTQRSVVLFEVSDPLDTTPSLVIWPANLRALNRIFGRGVATGDFNGDDTTDLIISMDGDPHISEPGHVYVYWGGVGFDTIPDIVFSRPGGYVGDGSQYFGWIIENLGDVSGDGWDDFIVGTGAAGVDTLSFIYVGGPSFDSIPDETLDRKATHIRPSGDLNSDGYNDFITAFELSSPSGSDVSIYLGGPSLDSIPDVVFYNSDLDGFEIDLGRDIAGIGDYNGDGKNDFAFSAEDANYKGVIYIYSGWSGATDVIDGRDVEVPTDFELFQNFPNPFNPTTTISFTLSRRMSVNLSVFNITGQHVCTLENGVLSAGGHSVVWSGVDTWSHPVTSGVYLLTLSVANQSATKKLVLIK